MLLIASANGDVGMAAGWEILKAGGSALDAVEAATKCVEDNPSDHTVGYGGYPNLLGEVELDASIMDGATRKAGTVGALKGYRYPITVARRVMEELPHVMLVGEGAAKFAAELGLEQRDMLSPEAAKAWREGIEGRLPKQFRSADGAIIEKMLRRAAKLTTDPEHVAGTVNFIAIDQQGNIASAVSTSGWAWKYPGRLGDSPIIGAGNYADNRYGAAACTGWGELAIRASTARSLVLYLKQGMCLEEACRESFNDLADLHEDPSQLMMNLVALDKDGNHCAISTNPDASYVYQSDGMETHASLPRIVVKLG